MFFVATHRAKFDYKDNKIMNYVKRMTHIRYRWIIDELSSVWILKLLQNEYK